MFPKKLYRTHGLVTISHLVSGKRTCGATAINFERETNCSSCACRVIDTFIPGLLLLWSLVCVFTALLRHRRASSNLYKPLKPSAAAFPRYGATAEVLPTSTAETEHDDEDDRSSSETAIVVPGYKERATRWSLFNWVRLLAVVPFGLYVYGLQQIASGDYALDEAVEGGLSDSLRVYVTSALYWVGHCQHFPVGAYTYVLLIY